MSDLVFYTNPMSRGRVVRWMLEEIGAPYRTEILDFASVKKPDYLAINPMGKIPALKHGDQVVTEVAAICTYLADAFPAANLAPPPGSPLRAPYYRWLFYAAGPLESAVTNKALGVEVPPEKQVMCGYGTYSLVMDTLQAALASGPYLLGDQFSTADVCLGSQIAFGLRFGSMDSHPSFASYVARPTARPAYAAATAIDDGLIKR